MISRSRWLLLVLPILVPFSCGDGSGTLANVPDTIPSSTVGTTTSIVPTSTIAPITVPTTITVSTTPQPPTTTIPVVAVAGVPGGRIEVGLPASPSHSVPDGLPLRMSPANGDTAVSGYLGTMRVDGDGVRLVGSIPAALVRTGTGADSRGPVTPLPTPAGDYFAGLGFVTIRIQVTQDAPPFVPPVSQAPPVPVSRQLLGDTDLAGVALETPEEEATTRLIAALGPPIDTTPWSDTCKGQFRYLRWSALLVMFRRPDSQSAGRFSQYSYHVTANSLPPLEQRLATRSNITLGSTVAEARGSAGNGVFIGTSLGGHPPFDGWYVPGTEMIVFFDRDFVDPEARVRAIASPRGAALADC